MKYFTARTLLIVAAVIALLGFLSMHQYSPAAGFIWNVMNGEIYLTSACPPPPNDQTASTDENLKRLYAWLNGGSMKCVYALPYRWVFLFAIVVAASVLILRQRPKRPPE